MTSRTWMSPTSYLILIYDRDTVAIDKVSARWPQPTRRSNQEDAAFLGLQVHVLCFEIGFSLLRGRTERTSMDGSSDQRSLNLATIPPCCCRLAVLSFGLFEMTTRTPTG